jgi:hypothetical protein
VNSPPWKGGVAAPKAQTGWSFWSVRNRRGIYNVKAKETQRKELRNSSTAAEAVLWMHLKPASTQREKVSKANEHRTIYCRLLLSGVSAGYRTRWASHFEVTIAERDVQRTEYLRELALSSSDLRTGPCMKIWKMCWKKLRRTWNDHPGCAEGAATPPL